MKHQIARGWTYFACAVALLALVTAGRVRAAQQQPQGKAIKGRIVLDGGGAPRFTLPVAIPGRAAISIAINPQPDGTFAATLPLGIGVVGAPSGLPAGFSVKSLTYGSADLLKDLLNVSQSDTAELVIGMGAPRLGSISGRVTGLKSTVGVRVVLRNNTPGVSWEAPLARDGAFVLTKVIPGSYSVRVSYAGVVTRQQVTLANEDLTGILLEMSKDRIILGHIIVNDGVAPDVAVQAKSAAGQTITSVSTAQGRGENLGRTFKLTLSAGEFTLSVPTPPAGYRVESMSYGTTDLLKQPLQIDGQGLWEIALRLAPVR